MGNTVHGVNSQIRPLSEKNSGDAAAVSLIYDRAGNRKYLTVTERRRFLRAVEGTASELRTFCQVLSYTGARISEVLALAHIGLIRQRHLADDFIIRGIDEIDGSLAVRGNEGTIDVHLVELAHNCLLLLGLCP
jgi:hypothetical protein